MKSLICLELDLVFSIFHIECCWMTPLKIFPKNLLKRMGERVWKIAEKIHYLRLDAFVDDPLLTYPYHFKHHLHIHQTWITKRKRPADSLHTHTGGVYQSSCQTEKWQKLCYKRGVVGWKKWSFVVICDKLSS